jgi:hypothetical protein
MEELLLLSSFKVRGRNRLHLPGLFVREAEQSVILVQSNPVRDPQKEYDPFGKPVRGDINAEVELCSTLTHLTIVSQDTKEKIIILDEFTISQARRLNGVKK